MGENDGFKDDVETLLNEIISSASQSSVELALKSVADTCPVEA
jgi:hypothetical protein